MAAVGGAGQSDGEEWMSKDWPDSNQFCCDKRVIVTGGEPQIAQMAGQNP